MSTGMRRPETHGEREEVGYYQDLIEEEGATGYVEWIEDYLGVVLTESQVEILEAIHQNQKVIVVAGNGFGKTYLLACLTMAFLFVNYPASVLATSGTYGKMRRTYCKPIQNLHRNTWGLPGRYLKNPPRIVIDSEPEVFWEAASPRDPGELEGVHNEYTLGIVEEADKRAVTHDIFDSLESLLTDENDKIVAVANPPREETNVVYDLMDDSGWTLKQYSSFESHNVQVEMNHPDPYVTDEDGEPIIDEDTGHFELKPEVEDQFVPEIVRLSQIRQDWEAWNATPWPGVEKAIRSHEREDLDTRWYRRRMGVISPQAADVPRPFDVRDVEDAFRREPAMTSTTPQGMGWDVVRGGTSGDYNAHAAVFGTEIRMLDWWRGDDHLDNYETIRDNIHKAWNCAFAIDHVGVGSEAPDRVELFYPGEVVRFNAGANASEPRNYADRWTEGLMKLGQFLRDGGSFSSERLREELLVAARVLELEEKYARKFDTERWREKNRKDAIKDRLGRSPDLLDAAYMAVLMAEDSTGGRRKISSTW